MQLSSNSIFQTVPIEPSNEIASDNTNRPKHQSTSVKNNMKNHQKILLKYILFILLLIIPSVFLILYHSKSNRNKHKHKDNNDVSNINEVKIDECINRKKKQFNLTNKNIISKKIYNRSDFDTLFERMKVYEIDNSYCNYVNLNDSMSYYENAEIIYNQTGMINFTLLNIYYYEKERKNKNYPDFQYNHIHIGMAFDNNYTLVSLPTIASILNTSKSSSYIHFHLCITEDFQFLNVIRINSLKQKINNNSDFTFYSCAQGEIYYTDNSPQFRGVGDYLRFTILEEVNNTEKLLILDSGDIFVNKDLYELYNIDLEDKYFAAVIEANAGNKKVAKHFSSFFLNYLYFNGGVVLFNTHLWKKDNLYKKTFTMTLQYEKFSCPFQEVLLMISQGNIKYLDLKYNCVPLYNTEEEMRQKSPKQKYINKYIKKQNVNNPFKFSLEEIIEGASDPVITHCYWYGKCHVGKCKEYLMKKWEFLVNITGFREEIMERFTLAFEALGKMR